MTLLLRYLLKNNLFIMGGMCTIISAIFIITNFIDNISLLTATEPKISSIIFYYLYAVPPILSQMIGLLFLIVLLIQIALMQKSKELLALYASGISAKQLLRAIIIYAFIWGIFSFAITEFAIFAEQESRYIYRYEIRKRQKMPLVVNNLWLHKNNTILGIGSANVSKSELYDILLYEISTFDRSVKKVYSAERGFVQDNTLILEDIMEYNYRENISSVREILNYPYILDLQAISVLNTFPAEVFSIDIIKSIVALRGSGVPTASLKAALHKRMSNAVSIVMMAIIAVMVSTVIKTPYLSVSIGFAIAVVFFLSEQFFIKLGSMHLINPNWPSWINLILWSVFCFVFLYSKRKVE
ncbi:MAG: LptF/LptG family permease [Desulfovibrionaceae bacterium]